MTAPRWIAEAYDVTERGDNFTADQLAKALIERLPIEAMAAAVQISCWDFDAIKDACPHMWETADAAFPPPARVQANIVARIVKVLVDGDPEVVLLAELYQDAAKALDDAGVPYAIEGCVLMDLQRRIRWLAQQRPTRLDLERAEASLALAHRDLAQAQREVAAKEFAAADQRENLQGRINVLESELAAKEIEAREANRCAGEARAARASLEAAHAEHVLASEAFSEAIADSTIERDKLAADRDYWKALAEHRAAAIAHVGGGS